MIISVVNQKGGVAKTITTFTVGTILADQGYKTLVIDLDPQYSLTKIMGYRNMQIKNMYHVLCEKESIKNIIVNPLGRKNLFLAPSSIKLATAELKFVNEVARERFLEKALKEVVLEYDCILIDCNPSLGMLVVNALTASNKIIIPVACDIMAYDGFTEMEDTIKLVKENLNDKIEVLGLVLTMYDPRTLHSKEVVELLEDLGKTNANYKILSKIESSTKVKDSLLENKTIAETFPENKISKQYSVVVEEIKGVLK